MQAIQTTMIQDHGPEFTEASVLIAQVHDHRFIDEAINMAKVAYTFYDPDKHQLSHLPKGRLNQGQMTYHEFFRQVTPDQFRWCRNVKSAAQVLDILIAQGSAVAA